MKTAKEIAQWVIDNRYPKSENEKVSDAEMYHELVEGIEKLCNIPAVISRLKTDLDNWIDGCEKAAGNLRDIGHFKDAQKFDGQATAYWAVKNYLD
jgi:hypothetical protein